MEPTPFGARFRTTFGVTPKVTARLFRFEHATRLLQSGLAPAGVAVRCGYFDQAHMDLDFSSFGTSTPDEIAARRSTDSLRSNGHSRMHRSLSSNAGAVPAP